MPLSVPANSVSCMKRKALTDMFCRSVSEGFQVLPSSDDTNIPCLSVPVTNIFSAAAMALRFTLSGSPLLVGFHLAKPLSQTKAPCATVTKKILLAFARNPLTVASPGIPLEKGDQVFPLFEELYNTSIVDSVSVSGTINLFSFGRLFINAPSGMLLQPV